MKEYVFTQYMNSLGFSESEALVFKTLRINGASKVLEISQMTGIPRTNVYRIVEKLTQDGVLHVTTEYGPQSYEAIKDEDLKILLEQKAETLSYLNQNFATFLRDINPKTTSFEANTELRFYKGREGVRQMVWNILDAKEEVLSYTYRTFDEMVGRKFAKQFEKDFRLKKLKGRELVPWNWEEKSPFKKPYFANNELWQTRTTPQEVLDFKVQFDIYDDIVSIYEWRDEGIFGGIEFYNKNLAQLQKGLFELVWNMAK